MALGGGLATLKSKMGVVETTSRPNDGLGGGFGNPHFGLRGGQATPKGHGVGSATPTPRPAMSHTYF